MSSITITKKAGSISISAKGESAQALFDAISAGLNKGKPALQRAEQAPNPVKLQINQRGAWRDVMRFDMDTLADKSLFLDAAAGKR